jgi:hypothetical protein
MLIRAATPEEEKAFFGRNDPSVRDLRCAVIEGKVVAMSGVIRDPRFYGSVFEEDGRWIGFLSLADGAPALGWPAVAAMRQFLKTQTEPMVVQHDHGEPKAERLLQVLGFKPTNEIIPDFRDPSRRLRTWAWQPQPQS